ncbi:MAG: M56 family metallopeptidase, partial [Lachnospiraceae bacterium]|nr:M56 family metallopeptidase [Lachnospiraceae bacterium]
MPERLIVWIIQVSVTGGFSIIVFGVLSWIFRKKYRAGSRKKGWILIAVCLLFPLNMNILPSVQTVEIPAFYMTDYKGSMPVGNNAPGVMQDINGSVQGIQGMENKVPDMPENGAVVLDNFPTGRVLFIIWSVGVMFLTAYYVTAYRRMYRKVKRWSHDCKDSVLLKMASDIGVEIGLKIMPQIRIMESSSNGPFTMGVLKVNVCVPQSVSSEKELYYVLKHELIHCREKDILWKFLFLAVNVVHWFNPLVWLMRRLAGNDIEQACDEDVLKDVSMSGYREYSNVILAWAEHSRQNPLSVGYVAGTVFLKWRLSNIYE